MSVSLPKMCLGDKDVEQALAGMDTALKKMQKEDQR